MLASGKSALSSSAFDWSGSPLGQPDSWLPSLRLAADLVLNTPLPMLLVWGRGMTVLFNDAYAAAAGPAYGRVPGGIVPPVMPPPLAAAGDELQRAWNGDAAHAERRTLVFAGGDVPGGSPYDLYFTPVRGDDGAVEGVVCALAPAEPVLAVAQDTTGPLRILVVEDNVDSQYLVCEMLRAFGHEADGVGHPNDALDLLAKNIYDVLFTDVSLPGMSGVELARKVVAEPRAGVPAPRVIFASGYGDTLLRHVEFPYLSLQKPYELDQLQAALDKVGREASARA
jgi:CheY-like chemotaxis protein